MKIKCILTYIPNASHFDLDHALPAMKILPHCCLSNEDVRLILQTLDSEESNTVQYISCFLYVIEKSFSIQELDMYFEGISIQIPGKRNILIRK